MHNDNIIYDPMRVWLFYKARWDASAYYLYDVSWNSEDSSVWLPRSEIYKTYHTEHTDEIDPQPYAVFICGTIR
jgi:hypothetical protein